MNEIPKKMQALSKPASKVEDGEKVYLQLKVILSSKKPTKLRYPTLSKPNSLFNQLVDEDSSLKTHNILVV